MTKNVAGNIVIWDPIERLQKRSVLKPNGCLEWTGTRDHNGYGRTGYQYRSRLVHRLAYIFAHKISLADIDGLVIRHKCDNSACINPDHLVAGTVRDNVNDRVVRNRTPRGSAHANSKLTEEMVRQIRQEPGSETFLGRKYRISSSSINKIRNRKAWTHVD